MKLDIEYVFLHAALMQDDAHLVREAVQAVAARNGCSPRTVYIALKLSLAMSKSRDLLPLVRTAQAGDGR